MIVWKIGTPGYEILKKCFFQGDLQSDLYYPKGVIPFFL